MSPRLVLPLAAALLAVGLVVPSAQAAEPQLTAVLSLARPAGTTAALHRLAGHRSAPGAVQHLRPPARHRDAALRFARQQGLKVVRADAWSVSVSGSATAVTRAFGGALRRDRTGSWVQGAGVPAGLRADVSSVVGLDSRRLHRPHATADGEPNPQTPTSLRAAYDVPDTWRGAGITVGILNLAGWHRSDLDAFAGREVPTRQVEEVPVGLDPTELDGFGSEYEVALDSEAVLGAAPEAKQRLYFAPNTIGGVVSAVEAMATDAEAGLLQVATTSWGSCERDFDEAARPEQRAAYRAAIDRLVAAGATLFAASGDGGAFDCAYPDAPDGEAQVDFPASYPNTVAVGGTTLTAGQPETGWHDSGFGDYLGDGSGGGESVDQPRPAYQVGIDQGTGRLVPDIAADADPQSGLGIVVNGRSSTAGGTSLASPLWAGMLAAALSSQGGTTGVGNVLPALYASAKDPESPGIIDITDGHNGLFHAGPGFDLVTGLGVPAWTALADDLLATTPGLPTVGGTAPGPRPAAAPDPVLVAGYTNQVSAPVSVTASGDYTGFAAGETVDACSDLQPTAPTSAPLDPDPYEGEHELVLTAYDSGHVCHRVTAAVVYDVTAPTTTVMSELVSTRDTLTRLRLGGSDETSGIASWEVIARDSANHVVFHARTASAAPVVSAFGRGQRYVVTAVARDRAGNVGSTATTAVTLPQDENPFARSGTWARTARSLDYNGSHLSTAQGGASATLTARTRRLEPLLLRGPEEGYTDVYVDGRRTGRLDLYAPTTTAYRPVLGAWVTATTHTLTLVNVGAHRPASKGSYLLLDGVLILT